MNQPRILTIICASFLLWMACTADSDERASLSNAIHVVDENPQKALALLESMANPELLSDYDKDRYMQYVVILTQARYMDYQDIMGDSLILDAQRYFAKTHNYDMAARASYYAAAYWYEGEAGNKAVEYWQAAFSFAKRAGNDLFTAKSAYGLGISYYNQEQWEDAMTYCQKALTFYDNRPNAERYKFSIMEMLGQIYREQKDFERAYLYFDNGLKAAKGQNNTKYESRFLRNKGIIHWEKKEYSLAKEYFDLALNQPEPEDKLRIYLSYAKLYREMNRPDSTLHYLSLIENRIPEITYPNTRRDMYLELATHYKSNKGDGEKIALYSQLAYTEDLRIKKIQSEKKIEAIHQQLEQVKHKKQTEGQRYRRMISYWIIAFLVLVSLLVIVEMNKHKLKEKYRQIRHLQFSRTVDQQHFLLAGLRSIAKSADDLYQKELAYAGSPVWEQQLVLRHEFSIQIAECIKQYLERCHNGRKVLSKLTLEDLLITHLSQMKLPDDTIGWMLGHQGNKEEHIMLRKGQIRRIMAEVGMRNKDIRMFLP